jgi:hypothetical protein
MKTATIGQVVAWSQDVIRRSVDPHLTASARGVVVNLRGDRLARVDWRGTWIEDEDGETVRTVPLQNLVPVLRSGAVFGD